jgi:hypothetical protein
LIILTAKNTHPLKKQFIHCLRQFIQLPHLIYQNSFVLIYI